MRSSNYENPCISSLCFTWPNRHLFCLNSLINSVTPFAGLTIKANKLLTVTAAAPWSMPAGKYRSHPLLTGMIWAWFKAASRNDRLPGLSLCWTIVTVEKKVVVYTEYAATSLATSPCYSCSRGRAHPRHVHTPQFCTLATPPSSINRNFVNSRAFNINQVIGFVYTYYKLTLRT